MNRLAVSLQQSIHTLHARGWSARRIARELGLHRETVGRQLKLSKPAKVTTGSAAEAEAKPANVATGSVAEVESKPAKVATGSRSLCEPHREIITAALLQGLSAIRIHQDLVTDHAFTGRYNTVKRFAHALSDAAPLPFRRIETAAGEEMQVDFGQGAPVIDPTTGKRRRPHLFRDLAKRSGCKCYNLKPSELLPCRSGAIRGKQSEGVKAIRGSNPREQSEGVRLQML